MTILPTPEFKLGIPDEPVDQYRVRWWAVNQFGITQRHAIYHVDSPYTTHHGTVGKRIVNEWMSYEDGHAVGRSAEGWGALNRQSFDARFYVRYKTYYAAKTAYAALLDGEILRLSEDLRDVQKKRDALR